MDVIPDQSDGLTGFNARCADLISPIVWRFYRQLTLDFAHLQRLIWFRTMEHLFVEQPPRGNDQIRGLRFEQPMRGALTSPLRWWSVHSCA